MLASSRPSYNVLHRARAASCRARGPQRRAAAPVADEPDTWPQHRRHAAPQPRRARAPRPRASRDACATDEDHSPCWRPILVREDLSRDIVAELKQHATELAGRRGREPARSATTRTRTSARTCSATSPRSTPRRSRSFRPQGYDEHDRRGAAEDEPARLRRRATSIGATGVERAWESYLRGQRGWEKRVVDARGRYRTGPEAERLLDAPPRQEPLPGRDLRLTIDIELDAGDRARDARRTPPARSVVVDVRTGRLLALYSQAGLRPERSLGRRRAASAFARRSTSSTPIRSGRCSTRR